MTSELLGAMSGGELLRSEAGYFSQVRSMEKSTQRFKGALVSKDFGVTLCLLNEQQKHRVIYRVTINSHSKLVDELNGQCQDTLVQFDTFLGSSYSVDEHMKRLPSIQSMLQEYHMYADVEFFLGRSMFTHQINQKYDRLRKSNGSGDKKLSKIQKQEKYLEATAITILPIVNSVHPLHPAKVWEDISLRFLVTFWLLCMYQLDVPNGSYEVKCELSSSVDRCSRKELDVCVTSRQKLKRKLVESASDSTSFIIIHRHIIFLRGIMEQIQNREESEEILDGVYIRETRQKRYVQSNGEDKPRSFANKNFRPIPKESLDNVHKLRLRPVIVKEKRLRTINLIRKPKPYVKMPALKQLITVKTEKEHYGMSDTQLSSIDRMAEKNPQHRGLLRSYLKARPTKSLTPAEFNFLDCVVNDGLKLLLSERGQENIQNANATTLGSTDMSIASATGSLRTISDRSFRAKKSTRGSNNKTTSSISVISSSAEKQQAVGISKVKRMNKKIFSSTGHNSDSFSGSAAPFSPILSEEDFSSIEKKSTSNTDNLSSPAQLLSPRTQKAFDNDTDMQEL